jgi:hypothetical protein
MRSPNVMPVLVAVIAISVAVVSRVEAQAKGSAIPKCEPRKLLVAGANGQLECASLADVLKAQDCTGVLTFSSSDGLKCLRPSTTSWNAELLLPDCSSGLALLSDGFGRWKCVEKKELLPQCSSGEALVSEGSSGFRCTELLPRCSSGEELESEGSGRWRSRRRN